MQTNAGQLTPNDVAANLAKLARELDMTIRQLESAERDLVERRAAADLAFSQAFLAAEGSVDARKHQAAVSTHQQRLAADVAEALVRHLRRRIDGIKVRVEVGRSVGAAVRTELNLAGLEDTP